MSYDPNATFTTHYSFEKATKGSCIGTWNDMLNWNLDQIDTKIYEAATGGTLPKLDDLNAPDDNADLNFSTTKHGLCPKAPDDAAKFLCGNATWAVPSGTGGGMTWSAVTTDTIAEANHGYIVGGSGYVLITLPSSPSIGDRVAIVGTSGSSAWQVTHPGEVANIYTAEYLDGVTGAETKIASTIGDAIVLVCTNASAPAKWHIESWTRKPWQTLDNLPDVNVGSATQGTILYKGATEWVGLAGGTNNYVLTTHGVGNPTWEAASGNVSGASASVDNEVARFSSTTGKVIKNSAAPVTISDAGTINIPAAQTYNINGLAHTHSYTFDNLSDVDVSGAANGAIPVKTVNGWEDLAPGATANRYLKNDGSGNISWGAGVSAIYVAAYNSSQDDKNLATGTYTCLGPGNDDEDIIQLAIDAAKAAGSVVLLAAGDYHLGGVTPTDIFVRNHSRIIGAGPNATIIHTVASTKINCNSSQWTYLKGFTITGVGGLYIGSSHQIFEDIVCYDLDNSANAAFYIVASSKTVEDLQFIRCEAIDCDRWGWTNAGEGVGMLIKNVKYIQCRAINCGRYATYSNNSEVGYSIGESCPVQDTVFIDCEASGCAESGWHAEYSGTNTCTNVKLIRCRSIGNGTEYAKGGLGEPEFGAGYTIQKGGIELIDCYAEGNRLIGYRLSVTSPSTGTITVQGCTDVGSGGTGAAGELRGGFLLWDSNTYAIVCKDIAVWNSPYPINFYSGNCSGIVVDGARIYKGTDTSGTAGVLIRSGVTSAATIVLRNIEIHGYATGVVNNNTSTVLGVDRLFVYGATNAFGPRVLATNNYPIVDIWKTAPPWSRVTDGLISFTNDTEHAAVFKKGRPIRYRATGGTWRYGIISGATSTNAQIVGHALTTSDDDEMQYADMNRVISIPVFIEGTYEDASEATLIKTDGHKEIKWGYGAAYLVRVKSRARLADTSNKDTITIYNESNSTTISLLQTADGTWSDSDIYSAAGFQTYYKYEMDSVIEIAVTRDAAGNGDAQDLAVQLTFILA